MHQFALDFLTKQAGGKATVAVGDTSMTAISGALEQDDRHDKFEVVFDQYSQDIARVSNSEPDLGTDDEGEVDHNTVAVDDEKTTAELKSAGLPESAEGGASDATFVPPAAVTSGSVPETAAQSKADLHKDTAAARPIGDLIASIVRDSLNNRSATNPSPVTAAVAGVAGPATEALGADPKSSPLQTPPPAVSQAALNAHHASLSRLAPAAPSLPVPNRTAVPTETPLLAKPVPLSSTPPNEIPSPAPEQSIRRLDRSQLELARLVPPGFAPKVTQHAPLASGQGRSTIFQPRLAGSLPSKLEFLTPTDALATQNMVVEGTSHSTPTGAQTATSGALPPHVSRQLAEAMQQSPNRPVNITLSPEELGRVRLSMTSTDLGIVVNVVAERPETLDLLRRHIDQLGQDFQAMGYEDIAFSFAGKNDAQSGDSNDTHPDGFGQSEIEPDDPDKPATQIHLEIGPATSLDLRV